MKFTTSLFAIALIAGLASSAAAQTSRVAYVDIDRVTERSDKINNAMKDVRQRVEDIQKEIEEKRKRATDLDAEVKKGEGVLAEGELKKKKDELTKLKDDLVNLEYEGRREMQKLDSTLFEPMVKTIVLAIQDVAKEKNIDLVVRGEAVIYGADSADITDDVVKKLNSDSYNPGGTSSKKSSGSDKEKETAKSSNESATSESKSSSSTKEEEKSSTKNAEESIKKSIIPSVPLVTRPVDRQAE